MLQPSSVAYACLNSIGNSLDLEAMVEEIVVTFVRHTGAIGGKYIGIGIEDIDCNVHVGHDFTMPLILTKREQGFEIHAMEYPLFILDILIREGHFLFAFESLDQIESFGTMFNGFRIKISNAIEACYNVEKLAKLNQTFEKQISEEKNKNAFNEQLMISQSRMAIMGEMIGMIAHQWRQPITIIGMVTNNMIIDLHVDSFEKERAIKDLETVDKQVHYLSRTIDDFRNFFKPNKLAQTISFMQIANELKTILGKSFESNNIALLFEGNQHLKIVTFRNELIQVLLNILTNAKDAFGEQNMPNAFVKVSIAQYDSNTVTLFIEDNAGGIDPSIIDKIFDPYFSTKNEKNGTGLGLYMSVMIVENHLGGTIQVCSDDTGSIFQIRLSSQKGETSVY